MTKSHELTHVVYIYVSEHWTNNNKFINICCSYLHPVIKTPGSPICTTWSHFILVPFHPRQTEKALFICPGTRDLSAYRIGDQRWHRWDCTSVQSRQSLHCSYKQRRDVYEGSCQHLVSSPFHCLFNTKPFTEVEKIFSEVVVYKPLRW